MEKIKISKLVEQLISSDKDQYDFCDVVELDNALNRHIHIGDIDSTVADSLESYIRFFNRMDEEEGIPEDKREPIKIFIDSHGGDLVATFTMIDAILLSKTPVWTINIGCAYSGGFFIFLAGARRLSYSFASFLFHEGSTANGGDANKFNNFADFYKIQLKQLREFTIKNTNITQDVYEKHMKDDWWFSAREAIRYGICDEIVTSF